MGVARLPSPALGSEPRHTAGKAQYTLEERDSPNSCGPPAPAQLWPRAWERRQDEDTLLFLKEPSLALKPGVR